MGGPGTLPEPVSRRLRCLRICMVCGFCRVFMWSIAQRPNGFCCLQRPVGVVKRRVFCSNVRLQSWSFTRSSGVCRVGSFFFTSLLFCRVCQGGVWVGINVVFMHISVAICLKSCMQLISIKRGDHFCPTLYWNRGHNAQKGGFYLEVVGQRPWRGADQWHACACVILCLLWWWDVLKK